MKKILSICTIILSLFQLSFAQGIYNNGATIVIPIGTVIYIDGDANGNYLNEVSGGDGEVDIDGEMIVEGDWTNNASNNVFINPGTDGIVTLKGTTTQTIGGTNTTTFENLTINNTTAGTAVSLSLNTTVGSTLTLTDGVVVTGTDTLILTSTIASDLQPNPPASPSFINGNFRRYIANNTSSYFFALGDGTAGTDFYLVELINGSLTGVTYIDSRFGALTNHVDGDITASEEGTPYTSVSTDGVWFLDANSAPTGGNYDLKLWITNFSGLIDNQFAILKRPSGSLTAADWDCSNCGFGIGINPNGGLGRMVTDDYALRMDLTGFSQFAIAKSGVPLPIELLYFDAQYNKNTGDVDLTWITATEINNDYFTVERSVDAIDFEKVVTVPGAGNSSQTLYYAAVDKDPYYGISYYRLKQTDYDGKYEFSNIVAVMILKTSDLIIYPNPAIDNLTFLFSDAADANALIKIFDVQGKLVYLKRHKTVKGINQINISLHSFSQGMYFVTLIADKSLYKAKFVKEE